MDPEYVCVSVPGHRDETEAAFRARLTQFWTHMVRTLPEVYESVYAEATAFGQAAGTLTREYMMTPDAYAVIGQELIAQGFAAPTADEDELYTKYEATPPDWFWLEH
jgi:hypothetical protein